MERLAIYDMDRTVTHAPTWTAFLLFGARTLAPWRLALFPVAVGAGLAYVGKAIDRATLKQVSQRLLFGRVLTPVDAARVADAFADRVVAAGIYTGARAQLAADRAAGYRLVMATASYRYYAAAIAERLGFDDVIGTEAASDEEGRLRPKIDGENCYGPAKLRRLERWLTEQGIARGGAHVRFYSDHVSDAPVLGWADEAFAVNAHGPLKRLARERGWTVVDWER